MRTRPLAVKLPAVPGWRVIWFEWVKSEPQPGVHLIRPTMAIDVSRITFWGIDAPRITPGDPAIGKPTVEWSNDGLIPLVGPEGRRLPKTCHYFEMIEPMDPRSDEMLKEYCGEWFAAVDRSAGR